MYVCSIHAYIYTYRHMVSIRIVRASVCMYVRMYGGVSVSSTLRPLFLSGNTCSVSVSVGMQWNVILGMFLLPSS